MAIITSDRSGSWHDTKTWIGGSIPGNGDTAIIDTGHEVVISQDVTVGTNASATTAAITVERNAVLLIKPSTASITLTLTGKIHVDADGRLTIGDSDGTPVPSGVTVTVHFAGSYEFENSIEGTFEVFGYPNYHMADIDSQKARLVADAAAGAGVDIIVDRAVDWHAGDTLWIGTGGDPEHAPTGNEQVTISAKVSSTQYTIAALANNHFGTVTYGDVVIHGSRNVIIRGDSDVKGFTIRNGVGTASNVTARWNINWCRFLYGGKGTTTGSCLSISGRIQWNIPWPAQAIRIKNCLFDQSGDSAAYAIYMYYCGFDITHKYTDFINNHVYLYNTAIYPVENNHPLYLGHLSCLEMSGTGVYGSVGSPIGLNSFWYVSDATSSNSGRCAIRGIPIEVLNFKIHRAYASLATPANASLYSSMVYGRYESGEIFNNYYYGFVWFTGSPPCKQRYLFKDLVFRSMRSWAIYTAFSSGSYDFINCSFDGCNSANTVGIGAAYISFGANNATNRIRFTECTFGTIEQNNRWNVFYNATHNQNSTIRVIYEKCTCKIPANFAAAVTYDWFGGPDRQILYAIGYDTFQDWRVRSSLSSSESFEMIDCSLLDAAGIEKWAGVYPNTDTVGYVEGGGEIHKVSATEVAGYRDGSFARKLLPFNPTERSHMTKAIPIRIPVSAGETVEVSLYMKKNISQSVDLDQLPKIHLLGCGIYEETSMPNTTDTWEQVTVSGTALVTGTVFFWVSCWGVPDIYDSSSPPARGYGGNYTWAYPIDPGGTGAGPGNPDNLILYCDEINVTRT